MKNTITFRPSKKNNELINQLTQLAVKNNRSLNNYIETVLRDHIKNTQFKLLYAGVDLQDPKI
jgi:predicted HicB family RNase H-like nuclease